MEKIWGKNTAIAAVYAILAATGARLPSIIPL